MAWTTTKGWIAGDALTATLFKQQFSANLDYLKVALLRGLGAFTLTDGATVALDASLGSKFRLVALGSRTLLAPTNAQDAQKIIIEHYASGGARTLTLTTGAGGFRFGTDVTGITQTASGKTDYIGAVYNAADSRWDVVAVVKGY